MRSILTGLCAAALCLSLTACGGGGEEAVKPFSPADDAKTLLDSGAFSEALTEIDQETACLLYGIDPETVSECAVYGSTGATAEELAIFLCADEDGAEAAATALGYRVEDRIDGLRDYLPDEITKLEGAIIQTRGNSVLLAVVADYAPVKTFLGG